MADVKCDGATKSDRAARATHTALLVLLVLATLLASRGYRFGAGDSEPQALMVERLADPQFLERDFFVNSTQGVTPRLYYCWAVLQLRNLVGLELSFFLLAVVTAGLSIAALGRVYRLLVGNAGGRWLGVALACLAPAPLVHVMVAYPTLAPKALTVALSLWSLALLLGGRSLTSLGLAIAGTVFQPQVAFWFFALGRLGYVAAIDRKSWRREAGYGLAYLAAASAMWFPVWRWHGAEADGAAAHFARIIGVLRAGIIFCPKYYAWHDIAAFAARILAFVILHRWVAASAIIPRKSSYFLGCVSAVGLAMWLGGVVLASPYPSQTALLVWPQRAAVFFHLALSLYVGLYAAGRYRQASSVWGKLAAALAVGVPCLGVCLPAARPLFALPILLDWAVYRGRLDSPSGTADRWLAGAGILVLGLVVALAGASGQPFAWRLAALLMAGITGVAVSGSGGTRRRRRAAASFTALAVLALALAFARTWAPLRRAVPLVAAAQHIYAVPTKPFERIAQWCRSHLPRQALVLTPPQKGMFRLLSRRAIVVDWKCIPIGPSALVEWERRVNDVSPGDLTGPRRGQGLPPELGAHYRLLGDQQVLRLQKGYGATHFVTDSSLAYPFAPLHRDGDYVVYRLPATDGS